jgi:hypothetical protein
MFWKIIFGIAIFYYSLNLLGAFLYADGDSILISIFQSIGEIISLLGLYLFVNNIKFRGERWLGWLITSYYILYFSLSYLFLSIWIYHNPNYYFQDIIATLVTLVGATLPLFIIYAVLKTFISVNLNKQNAQEYFWKFYFWLSIILIPIGFILIIQDLFKWTFYDYLLILTWPLYIIPPYMIL